LNLFEGVEESQNYETIEEPICKCIIIRIGRFDEFTSKFEEDTVYGCGHSTEQCHAKHWKLNISTKIPKTWRDLTQHIAGLALDELNKRVITWLILFNLFSFLALVHIHIYEFAFVQCSRESMISAVSCASCVCFQIELVNFLFDIIIKPFDEYHVDIERYKHDRLGGLSHQSCNGFSCKRAASLVSLEDNSCSAS